jgi:protein TonB
LAQTLAEKVPELLKAEVLPEKIPDKTPPPPPPDLKIPPPPFVPPPAFVIQSDVAVVDTITAQSKVVKPLISSPASIGRPHTCQQDYPPISQRLGEEGTTTLAFSITGDGNVTNISVAKSSGSDRLDSAAVNCASSWRYKPAIEAGHPVSVSWQAQVRWVLH